LQIPHLVARSSLVRLTTALLLAPAVGACSDSLRSLGPTPAVAESNASELFQAFTARFSPNEFGPKYGAARVRLVQSALTPSRVFDDTTVWEARPSPTSRLLYVGGAAVDGNRYHLESRATPAPVTRPGDTRHVVWLESLEPNVYRWDTHVELAVGAVTAEEMSGLVTALLTAAEGKTDRELRDDYLAAFPRAAAAFGHGFSIDSVRVAAGALGTTSIALTASFRPELMRAWYPALTGYLDKYFGPARFHFVLTDRAGVVLFDVRGANRAISLHWRVQQGHLTSLFGPPKPWADSLVLTADLTLKVKLFTVGVQGLVTDFVISNSGHDRGWTVVARREPKWVLPMLTERLIRTPLRRPFAGDGSSFRLSVRDSAGSQSLVGRHTRLDVQESTIMRFLGSLASHAVGDLDVRVEAEEDRFLRDGFAGLDGDLRSLAPRWPVKAGSPEIESATRP